MVKVKHEFMVQNLLLRAAIVGMVILLAVMMSSCQTWQAEDRYHIGPDPTRPTKEEVVLQDPPEVYMEALPDPAEAEGRLPFVPPDPSERKPLPVPEQVFSVWKHFPDEEIKPTLVARK